MNIMAKDLFNNNNETKKVMDQIIAKLEEKFISPYYDSEGKLAQGWTRLPLICLDLVFSHSFLFKHMMKRSQNMFEIYYVVD